MAHFFPPLEKKIVVTLTDRLVPYPKLESCRARNLLRSCLD